MLSPTAVAASPQSPPIRLFLLSFWGHRAVSHSGSHSAFAHSTAAGEVLHHLHEAFDETVDVSCDLGV